MEPRSPVNSEKYIVPTDKKGVLKYDIVAQHKAAYDKSTAQEANSLAAETEGPKICSISAN